MKRKILIVSALLTSLVMVQACAKASKESGQNPTPTTSTAPAADSIGVPECDDYISKYEKCVNSKVPEMARAAMKSAFDQTRASWKTAAATPEGKQGLAAACKMAHDSTKQAVAAYGCEL